MVQKLGHSTMNQMTILLNDEFVDEQTARVPVRDAGLLYGWGVYESMRTFGGQFKLLDQHLKRLKQSARALSIEPPDAAALTAKLNELIRRRQSEEPGCDFRIRITLTAGNADLRTNAPGTPTLLITAIKLAPPLGKPLTMQSYQMTRQLPAAKTTAMLPAILAQQYAFAHNADEALLIDNQNNVHEGSFCNVYLIKDGVLKYPESTALKGVTQGLLLELTAKLLPAEQTLLTLDDFLSADEVFTSGSIRGVKAVQSIDGQSFKAPGPYTIQIQDLYTKWTQE